MSNPSDAVLVVDDDAAIGKVLVALLRQRGLDAAHVSSAEEALTALEARPYDVVLSDIRMPGMDGMDLLDRIAGHFPGLPVVLLTAHGSVALAVEAMKRGAADFVQKPFDKDEIGFVVEKALAASRRVRAGVPPPPAGPDRSFVGESPALKDVFATIRKVAPTNATVLVRGETGTGKELVARALHETSPRKDEAFVSVHCAALPETLLESELFGHERGAFTGAAQRKPGRIELAHKGTLFLDEIGEVPRSVQVKLLRVIQERELERVGGTQTIRVDVRIIAATHRDLEAMVPPASSGRISSTGSRSSPSPFRRSASAPGTSRGWRGISSLTSRRTTRNGFRVDDDAVARLAEEAWPGNVRQLQNFIERLVVLAEGDAIRLADVERELTRVPGVAVKASANANADADTDAGADAKPGGLSLDTRRRETEREALMKALAHAGNNRTRAAPLLEVSRRTLYNKLKEHGLD
jgi:DNA-binding NtrC family response regulator